MKMYEISAKFFNPITISIVIGIVTSYVPVVISEAVIKFNFLTFISIVFFLVSIGFGFMSLSYRGKIEEKINAAKKENSELPLLDEKKKQWSQIEEETIKGSENEVKGVMLCLIMMFVFILILGILQGLLQKEKISISAKENKSQYDTYIKKIDSMLISLSEFSFDVTKENYHNSLQKQPQSYQNYLQINPLFDNCNSLSSHFSSAYYHSCTEDRTK